MGLSAHQLRFESNLGCSVCTGQDPVYSNWILGQPFRESCEIIWLQQAMQVHDFLSYTLQSNQDLYRAPTHRHLCIPGPYRCSYSRAHLDTAAKQRELKPVCSKLRIIFKNRLVDDTQLGRMKRFARVSKALVCGTT